MTLLVYLAGLSLIAAVSWVVAWPFFRTVPATRVGAAERSPWEARREYALASLRDAELDFHVGKLSEADYRDLRARLETEALEAIDHLEEEAHEPDDR